MNLGRYGVLVGCVLAMASIAGTADHGGGAVRIVGKVKSVGAEAASIEVQDERETFTVELDAKTVVTRCTAGSLKGCAAGTTLHVLGHAREAGRRQKAFVQGTVAVVAGEVFMHAPIPSDLASQELEWVSGKLSLDHGHPRVGTYELHVAIERSIAILGKVEKSALASGVAVLVEAEKADGARTLRAKKIAILTPDLPRAEAHAAFGL
jgi:hypothetical protein